MARRPGPSREAPKRPSRTRPARVARPGGRSPPLVVCRLSVPLPPGPWVQRFTSRHPEVTLEVLDHLDLGRAHVLMGVQVRSDSPGAWAEEIRGLPGVVAVEELGPRGSATHLRVVHRTSAFLPVFRMLQLQQRFPFTIQNGVASWVVIGAEGKIRRLLALLRRRSPGLGVVSVSHQEAPGRGPLTVRQTEIFRRAMARGYFEVPRRVTLSELAGEMQMAISSLSEALAVIERKLLVRAQELPATP